MALVAPIIVPALAAGMRPLVKTVVRGGMLVYDKGVEMIAEAGEQLSDLVAEARAEADAAAAAATQAAASATSANTNGQAMDS